MLKIKLPRFVEEMVREVGSVDHFYQVLLHAWSVQLSGDLGPGRLNIIQTMQNALSSSVSLKSLLRRRPVIPSMCVSSYSLLSAQTPCPSVFTMG